MVRANRQEPLVPAFRVTLNDEVLPPDVAPWVTRAWVEDDLDVPGMFGFELVSREGASGVQPWTDDERFALGSAVEVSFGYGDTLESVMAGEITALEPEFTSSGPPTLLVRGYDRRHRLNTVRRTRSFIDQKDSDIAVHVVHDAGVDCGSEDSGVTHSYVLQADQTDLEFLLERARRIRYEIAMDGVTLLFRRIGNERPATVTLSFDDDLFEFSPRMALVPVTEVRVRGWDPRAKDIFEASADTTAQIGKMAGTRTAAAQADLVVSAAVETQPVQVTSQMEADLLGRARLNTAALEFILAEGRCRGRTDLRAGTVVRFDALGTRFSGLYYVTSVIHSYTPRDGYVTQFRVRRNAS